jgi:hypothetical protein
MMERPDFLPRRRGRIGVNNLAGTLPLLKIFLE